MHINKVKIATLQGVSKVYKERLAVKGVNVVRQLIGWWGSEELRETLGSKHQHACFQIEHALKKLGYEFWFEPHLRKIESA